MSSTQESAANREASELAEQLEAMLPKVHSAIAYADDDTVSMRLERAVRSLVSAVDTVVSAKAVMGGD